MTTSDTRVTQQRLGSSCNPAWELSPNAPGVHWLASVGLTPRGPASGVSSLSSTLGVVSVTQYDEVDLRLMDTFPASDAVGRY